jgi:hypothetical protein
MNTANMHWELLAPEYILAGWAAAIILLDLFWGRLGKDQLGYVAALGAFIAAGVSLIWVGDTKTFGKMRSVILSGDNTCSLPPVSSRRELGGRGAVGHEVRTPNGCHEAGSL